MTYAYLKKYSLSTDKRGFYIDGPNWTLQASPKADRFFRQSTHYHDDTKLPLTVVKTMVQLGELETGGRTRKAEMLDWFPYLNPSYCEMNGDQVGELREFVASCIAESKKDRDDDLIEFLRHQTSIDTASFD